MAYASYSLESLVTLAGTVAATLWVDPSVPDMTGTIPAKNIESIEGISEKIEDRVGFIEIPSVKLKLIETYDDFNYPQGFWYWLVSYCALHDYGMPEIQLTLDEGGGVKHLFWGRFDAQVSKFNEVYLGAASNLRLFEVDLLAAITRVKDIDFQDVVTALGAVGTNENPTGLVTGLTVTPHGPDMSRTYGYRIAARDGNGEYGWCAEATTVHGPNALSVPSYNEVNFTGVVGATSYAIYRTTVSGGSEVTGFVGLLVSAGAGAKTYSDVGGINTAGSTQMMFSGQMFVPLMTVLRQIVETAFGYSYSGTHVQYAYCDFELWSGGSSYTLDNVLVLLKKNFGTIAAPLMDWANNFNNGAIDSTRGQVYWGSQFGDALAVFGHVAKHFAFYPRHNVSLGTNMHFVDLLVRGRSSATTVLSGTIVSSEQTTDTSLVPKTIRAHRASKDADGYPKTLAGDRFDLDFAMTFVVQDVLQDDGITHDYGYDYEKLYVLATSGTKVTASRIDAVKYWDYVTGAFVAATGPTQLAEAFVKYLQTMVGRYRKSFTRKYNSLKGNDGATTSQTNTKAAMKVEINDGFSTLPYYANTVKKDLKTNELDVELIQI
jgi:hypothetical protein